MRIATAGLVLMLAWLAPHVARADSASAHDAVTRALADGDYTHALDLATHAVVAYPKAAWPEYDRAVALKHLGRTDEAVLAFARVEDNPSAGALKAAAIFGRARALDAAGRCEAAHIAYDKYAALVAPTNSEAARIASEDARECYPHAKPDPVLSKAASALIAGDYTTVLGLTEMPATDEKGRPWLDYDRGSALAGLGKTDDAVAAFRRAETEFGGSRRWEQSIAIWGAANALDNAGRCSEAKKEYARYAALMRPHDTAAADMAERFADACIVR